MTDDILIILLAATCVSALVSIIFLILFIKRVRTNKRAKAKEESIDKSPPQLGEKDRVLLLENSGEEAKSQEEIMDSQDVGNDIINTKTEKAESEEQGVVYGVQELRDMLREYGNE